jgi:cell division protein FtsZ
VVAEAARKLGALTVAVVTKPFGFEGSRRMKLALEGIERLRQYVDTLIVIPNDRLLQVVDAKASVRDAFLSADDLLRQGIQGISDLITGTGLVNVDFNDVRAVMGNGGSALMSIGFGQGESRSSDAAIQAVNSRLLDVSIDGAKGVLFNIKGSSDLTLFEVNEAAEIIRQMVDPDANIIFGAAIDEGMNDEVQITVIATGFGDLAAPVPQPVPARTTASPRSAQSKTIEFPVKNAREDLDIPSFLRKGSS